MFTAYAVTLKLETYIADPYWPEVEKLVNLQKRSGMNACRTEDTRERKLRTYLEQEGLTMADYQELERLAKRPWYIDGDSRIIVPRHQLAGALVQGSSGAPAGARIPQASLRALLQISDFVTDRTQRDELFERYARPMDPKGGALSNQRALRVNEVIRGATARGSIAIDSDVKPETVEKLLRYVGKHIGAGASRKMGYGRFEVLEFVADPTGESQEDAAAA